MKLFRYLLYFFIIIISFIIIFLIIIHDFNKYLYLLTDIILHKYLLLFNIWLLLLTFIFNISSSYKYKINRRIYFSRLFYDLRHIFENLPIGIFIIDDNYIIKFINLEASKLLKIDKSANFKCSSICNNICDLTKIKKPIKFEHNLEINNIKLSSTIIPIFLDDGKLYVEFLYDSTFHQKTITELTKVVNFKSDVISMVSHELRSPLNAIKLSLSSILDGYSGDINDEVKDDITIAYTSTNNLISLVNDTLDISKLEHNKFEYSFELSNLFFIIKTSIDLFKPFFKSKNISWVFSCDEQLEFIFDKQRILQVFINLLSNSIKFTPTTGEISITVTKTETSIIIEFCDTGSGINFICIDQIFNKFYHCSDNILNPLGVGLGLYLVKNIISAHGGSIIYDPTYTLGTKFIITFPLFFFIS